MKRLYIFIILFSLLSCNKEDVFERESSIHIGTITDEIIVTTMEYPDTLRAEYNVNDELAIDLNRDGQNDIKIACWFSGSPGWGTDNGSYIEPMDNNSNILSFEKKDTVFYYHGQDTVYHDNFTEIFNSTFYESVNRHNSDSIYSITERSYSLFLGEQDILNLDGNWKNEKMTFRATGTGGGQNEQTNDLENNIIYYDWATNYKLYGTWPIGEINYIGIKYYDRIGWIKIKLESYSSIIVYEYALQK